MLVENEVVRRLLDDERCVAFEGIQQLVGEQPLVYPAEMVVGVTADGCNDRIDDGRQPAQAYDQLFRVVAVRPADNVGSPHVQKLLASFHKRGVEGG